jgi:hypothetical protein
MLRSFFKDQILLHGVKLFMTLITQRLSRIAAVLIIGAPDIVTAQPGEVPTDLLIKLERTACLGTCPSYTVSLDAAGNVTFVGDGFVRATGKHRARIPASTVATLFQTVRRTGFFELRDSYSAAITDMPMTIVTITAGGRTKRVEDYVAGPKELKQLQGAIDKATGTGLWIGPPMPPFGMRPDGGTNAK